ncbi:MAG: hypothetical protein ABSA62_15875, partial [Methyloceanibacter sp.]
SQEKQPREANIFLPVHGKPSIMQPAKRQGKGNRAEIFSQLQKGQNQAQFNVSGTPNPQELFLNMAIACVRLDNPG